MPGLRLRGELRGERITMLLENNCYPQDARVRSEAESLSGAGHEVTVIAPRGPGQRRRETINGVEVQRFRCPDGSRGGPLGFACEYLVAGVCLHAAAVRSLLRGATILHLHNPPDIFFAAGALYRAMGRRVVFDHHDLFPETVGAKCGSELARRVAAVCQRLTFATADHVLATNESYAEIACSAGRKRADAVTVVRNAPPAAWRALASSPRPGVLRDLRLAYLGATSSQDGVEALAPVLARLCDGTDRLDVQLTIVGDGDQRVPLERRFRAYGVADRVTFTGWVPRERVPRLLEQADVCVDPAPPSGVNHCSTMIKIAEYMALGKPVVAYDLLETRRTVGDAALLAPPGEPEALAAAISRLAHDPDLRARLANDSHRRAAELTWERSERALLAAYAALAGPCRSEPRARTPLPARLFLGWRPSHRTARQS